MTSSTTSALKCADDSNQCELCFYARTGFPLPSYRTTCHCGWLHFKDERCCPPTYQCGVCGVPVYGHQAPHDKQHQFYHLNGKGKTVLVWAHESTELRNCGNCGYSHPRYAECVPVDPYFQ